jgi:hypothetical protein
MSNMLKIQKERADVLGIMASSLCLIHCIATPFLFIAKACSATCCSDAPNWWKWIDYFFIIISFIAIYYATKNTTKKWMKIALWTSWVVLLCTMVNEVFIILSLPESFIYYPALSIVALHFYNRRYCSCKEDKCCTI